MVRKAIGGSQENCMEQEGGGLEQHSGLDGTPGDSWEAQEIVGIQFVKS